MRHNRWMNAAAAAMLLATPGAQAQDTAPPKALTLTGSATVVSDYRFRGISQSNRDPAIQGSLTLTHESGLYGTVWASTVDDYVTAASGGTDAEFDFIAGYKRSFGGTTVDVGALYYVYAKTKGPGDVTRSDFIEPFMAVSQTIGPVSAKVTANWAPKQRALALDQIGPRRSNFYLAGDASAAIPGTPVSLSAHLGHSWGPTWLTLGNEYTDWSLGAAATFKAITVGVQYVDTDGQFLTPSGKNAAGAGVVASVGFAF